MIVPVPEFSRPVIADRIPASGAEYDFAATGDECVALATRLGLKQIRSLSAHARLKPIGNGPLIHMEVTFLADVVQVCVITLEPLPASLDERFEMIFGPSQDDCGTEVEIVFDQGDPPDTLVEGEIDMGEAVAEHLSLALEPFPRVDGAAFISSFEGASEDEMSVSPFAQLARFRKNDG